MQRTALLVITLGLSLATVAAQPQGGSQGRGTPPSGTPPIGAPRPGQATGKAPVRAAALETRTVSITVAGRLEPVRRVVHATSVAGLVEAVHVRAGQRVTTGQALVTLVRDAPGESYRPLVIASRLDGLVSELHVGPGDEVRAGAPAVTVIDDSAYRLSAALSDKDAYRVATAAKGSVLGRAVDGARLAGAFLSVSAEPDYATGLFRAELAFPRQAGARLGLVVFVELPVDAATGVFIRRDLVVRRFGRSVVWAVGDDEALRLLQVKTGRPFGDDLLVESGLAPGTRIVARVSGYEKEGLSLAAYAEALGKVP